MNDHYKFGLQGKTAFVLGGLIFLVLTVTDLTSYLQSKSFAEQKVIELEQSKFSLLGSQIEHALENHQKNLLTLHYVPPIQAILRARANNGIDPEYGNTLQEWRARLAIIFGAFLVNHPDYLQIRYIDAAGDELVRVQKDTHGDVSVIAENELRNRFHLPYVNETLKMETGSIYYADVSLGQNDDVIRMPILRMATPVHDASGQAAALLVITIAANQLFDSVKSEVNGVQRHIVNEKGYYIKHSNVIKTFGFEQGFDYRFQHIEPELAELSTHQDTIVRRDASKKELNGFHKIYFSPWDHSRYWLLTLSVPEKVVFADITTAFNKMLQISLLMGVFSLFLIIWFTSRKILAPVVNLAAASRRLQDGDLTVRVDTSSVRDEFYTLFAAINTFAKNQQRATLLLDGQKERLSAVIDNVLDGIITFSENSGMVESLNPAAKQIFGYSNAEVIGQNVNMLIPDLYHSEHDDYLEHHITTNEKKVSGTELEITGLRKNGLTFPVELAISQAFINGAKYFVAIIRDITERKQHEADLIFAKTNAEEATRAKSEFLANMSHEIRTPMNGVLGMLELLERSNLEEGQKRYLGIARESATTLLAIINDILDLSKVEAGQLLLENTPFELRKIVEAVAITGNIQAANKNLEVHCFIPSDLPNFITGDPVRLRQILLNLMSNGIKFTHEGEVNLSIALKEETEEQLVLRFEIEDTGIGIAPKNQKKLFEAFTQEDSSITRKFGGTGLGLSICKQLANLMGGEIGVNSSEGQGSTFWVTAKFGKVAEQLQQCTNSLPDGLRVLGVDDNATNREILSNYLFALKIRHEIAEDAESALVLLREAATQGEPYQTVILDFQMPGMNGAELAHKIRTDVTLSATRLILLSSAWDADKVVKHSGIDRHLIKPVRQSDLYDVLLQKPGTAESCHQHRTPERKTFLLRNARVLLVDDMATNRIVGKEMLSSLGVEVNIVEDGQQAVNAVSKNQYDLVLMDCQMPGIDGYAATEIIRAQEKAKKTRRLPIIALTANAMIGDKEICLAAGMDGYLSKPLIRAELEIMLDCWLPDILESEKTKEVTAGAVEPVELSGVEATDDPLIDSSRLDELRQLTGESFKLMIESFEEDTSVLVLQLIAIATSQDLGKISECAHALKGISGNMAATRLSSLCKKLEVQANHGDKIIRDLSQQVDTIKTVYEQTLEAFKEEIQSP